MKIVGTNTKGWLIQVSSEEVEEIVGLDLLRDKSCKANYGKNAMIEWFMTKEVDFNLCENFKKLRNYNQMALNNGSYNSARKQLTEMLELITPVEELIATMAKKFNDENL